MSYDNDNFSADSNDFGRSGARGARASEPKWTNDTTDASFTRGQGGQQNPSQFQGQNQGDAFGNSGSGGLGYQGSQANATYAGDTQDVNVPGAGAAGGGFRSQRGGGRAAGGKQWEDDDDSQFTSSTGGGAGTGAGAGGLGGNDWDSQRAEYGSDSAGGDQFNTSGTGKPSMGQRLKGNVEKVAGKVSGRQDMVDRGQERKTNDQFGDNY